MTHSSEYNFLKALRPFSFAVALIACSSGITVAWLEGEQDLLRIVLVLVGGVLLQAGVNLINDYADISLKSELSSSQIASILKNYRIGLMCFLLASFIGFWFVYQVGLSFLLLCAVGLLGALGYTLQPINYKGRGLGVILVFWLMGVLMVVGSYTAVSGRWSPDLLLLSIPISLLVSLLLLSNELRDYEADKALGIETLVVKLGYQRGSQLYRLVLLVTALLVVALSAYHQAPLILLALLSFGLVPSLLKLLGQPPQARQRLTPGSGRFLMVFGVLYNISLVFGLTL
ncbi:prenyltransferase [Neptunomonas concharum]|uniref:Prenyltransferase n=1 Tax=Neptunomonas concharum TaxID=1031538 RepID=A0A5P1RDQ3_9GAMM|nr:prenyltransferase [Neptunomonas concharum]QEQ97401.1 prenyltransferase [Neptunomonas concharum]